MSLPGLSIRRPVFAWMLMAAIITFGCIAFHRLGVSKLPDVDFPVVSVNFTLNGAAPEVMESQVIDPVEDAIMQIDGIKNITSSAQQSSGSIAVEFELSTNIDRALEQIQDKINQVKNLLPTDLFPPTLRKTNPEDQPILWLILTSDNPQERKIDMLIYAKDTLKDRFSTLAGVGDIALGGYIDPALRVWMKLDKLNYYQFTADDVKATILSEQKEYPSGVITGKDHEYNVRILGEAASPEEFGKIRMQSRANLGPSYKQIRLSQLADIEEATADVRRLARFNGKNAVGIGIIKQHGSNAVEVADTVRKEAAEMQKLLPPNYHLQVRNDQTRFIKQSVDGLVFTLIMSALLTSLVCYLFLGSWTSTLNILLSIPTSIVGAFVAFYFCGFTLNTFTLLGLSLAIGIVVDDSIMMLENIVRHREMGMGKKYAALVGAEEITFAAMSATIAVVAIFMPVVFMKGIIGRYFLQYGITVTVAVLLSLLEALTLTPMRCSRFLVVEHESKGLAGFVDRQFARLANLYAGILDVLLNHRWKTIFITLIAFVASLYVAKLLPGEMMPAQDQSQLMLRFKLPVGTAIEVTSAKIKEVEDYLLKQPEVEGIFSAVGGFGGDAVNQGMAFVNLVDPDKRKDTQMVLANKFRDDIKKQTKGMQTIIQDLSLRGFAATRGFPVEFVIQGPDWETLDKIKDKVIDELKNSKYVVDVNTDIQPNMPETQIYPDRKKMAQYAVNTSTVTSSLNELVGGEIINSTNAYPKGRHRYEIEMRLVGKQRDKLPDLNQIKLRNNRGETVRLSDVVTQTHTPSLMLISRLNRSRAITIYANPAPGVSQQEAMKQSDRIVKALLPQGYYYKPIGSSESMQETFKSLLYAMALGILVSYMVLASQFDSFIHPVTVLMALPFSFSGAFIGLWIAHQTINMYSLIGFILLMGIVKKNSILLVDFTNQCRREGLDVRTALLKACPVRLRPIIMTSAATVAAAVPEAMHLAPGAESTIPMSVAIIGGVVASTILTLFVVPIAYSLLSKFEKPDPLAVQEAEARKAELLANAQAPKPAH